MELFSIRIQRTFQLVSTDISSFISPTVTITGDKDSNSFSLFTQPAVHDTRKL